MIDTSLPPTNKRKLIFVVIIATICLIIFGGILFLSGAGKVGAGVGFRPETSEVSLWTVNMSPDIFETMTKGFSNYIGRNDMKIRVRNFGSYEDFISVFPRVAPTDTPDVILVPNHGGHVSLDPYIVSLGENIIDMIDFEDRFHPLFFRELVFEEKQKIDGTNQIVRGLRGVPVGFEPLGMYYNRELLTEIPEMWESIMDSLTDEARKSSVSPISLGYGRATPVSPDVLAFLTIQSKGSTIDSYEKINSIETRSTLEQLLRYRLAPNNLSQFQTEYDNTLTNADLFVRGKVATLVGYPSTERDIMFAIARAKKDRAYDPMFEKNLRWGTIPQIETDPKKQTNFARYMYFAMTKNGINRNTKKPSNDPVIKFMQYLATDEAQKTFFQNYEYYLPAQITLLSESKAQINSKTGSLNMTIGDWYVPTQTFALYNKGMPDAFNAIVQRAMDEPGATANVISTKINDYLKCRMSHLSDPDTYSLACSCTNSLEPNNNNYWPVCEWGV